MAAQSHEVRVGLVRWFMNWLRRKTNAPIIQELHAWHAQVERECDREFGWDGVPDPLIAELKTLDRVLAIVDSDR